MSYSDSFTVCIPAGGSGLRMNSPVPKQYIEIEGKPILAHTLDVFDRLAACTRIVISAFRIEDVEAVLERFPTSTETLIVQGGATRQESVLNALAKCENENGLVMIHDAVRPCVSDTLILHVRDAITVHGAAMLAMPSRDTVKRVEHGHVVETLDRSAIWLAQTPQGAPLALLRRAFETAIADGYTGTDDASLLERIGLTVAVVEGSPDNIKITTREDIAVAATILALRNHAG